MKCDPRRRPVLSDPSRRSGPFRDARPGLSDPACCKQSGLFQAIRRRAFRTAATPFRILAATPSLSYAPFARRRAVPREGPLAIQLVICTPYNSSVNLPREISTMMLQQEDGFVAKRQKPHCPSHPLTRIRDRIPVRPKPEGERPARPGPSQACESARRRLQSQPDPTD